MISWCKLPDLSGLGLWSVSLSQTAIRPSTTTCLRLCREWSRHFVSPWREKQTNTDTHKLILSYWTIVCPHFIVQIARLRRLMWQPFGFPFQVDSWNWRISENRCPLQVWILIPPMDRDPWLLFSTMRTFSCKLSNFKSKYTCGLRKVTRDPALSHLNSWSWGEIRKTWHRVSLICFWKKAT